MKTSFVIFAVFFAMIGLMAGIGITDTSEYSANPNESRLQTDKNGCDTIRDTVEIPVIIKQPCDTPQFHVVTGTKYQPVAAQCDATPLNTADGSYIDTTKLEIYDFRWCALSQDLLWFNGGPYHYGDFIRVYSPNEEYSGTWQVRDCMNKRYTNRIDFLTWFNWPKLGVQENIVIHCVTF